MEKTVSKLIELSDLLIKSKFSIQFIVKHILQQAAELLDAEFSALLLNNKSEDKSESYLFYDSVYWRKNSIYKEFSREQLRIKIGLGLEGICAQKQSIQNLSLNENTSLQNLVPDYEVNFNIKPQNVLASPMLCHGELIGVLIVVNKQSALQFSLEDEKLLMLISSFAAASIEITRLREEVLAKERISNLSQSIINSAHGLKNILNNLDGGAFIVERGAALKNLKDVEKGWDIIKRNTHRLRELVLDILLYSRPQKTELKPANINQICVDIQELLAPNAEKSNVEIKLFLDRSINNFPLDQVAIHRCLLNLISNAVYACAQKGGGRVNVHTKLKDDASLEIIISDNGVGISNENLCHIFDIFFTTKGSSGTGLGLPVSKRIIEDHNGTINVSSTVNIGTKFIINIPHQKLKDSEGVGE